MKFSDENDLPLAELLQKGNLEKSLDNNATERCYRVDIFQNQKTSNRTITLEEKSLFWY